MAGWLYRNLKDNVDDLVVCDPRRNKLIACDGDKDDSIDAGKLAGLLRGGFLRFCYARMISMGCRCGNLPVGGWRRFYDRP